MPITALPKERINRLVQTIATILPSVEVVVRSGKLYDLAKKAFGFRLWLYHLWSEITKPVLKRGLVFTLSFDFYFQLQRSGYYYLVISGVGRKLKM